MNNGSKRYMLRSWVPGETSRPNVAVVHPDFYSFDMKLNDDFEEVVYTWTGEDRNGQPLTVQWLNPVRGTATLVAYEITDGGE